MEQNTVQQPASTQLKPLRVELRARLDRLLEHAEKVREAKSRPIVWTEPLVKHNGAPILYPNSILTIQGQTGTHKSRMCQNVVSALIAQTVQHEKTMGFEKGNGMDLVVAYIDTERNYKEQFPAAIQEILLNADYAIEDDPECLEYLPILSEKRDLRLETLTGYIRTLRDKHAGKHIVLVLDVVPDFIGSFNDERETYTLLDLLNLCINQFAVSFICVIHENPGSEKARGHLGTELSNKSSTVLQIAAVKNKRREQTGTFKVRTLKQRSGPIPPPFFVLYDEELRNLRVDENVPDGAGEDPDSRLKDAIRFCLGKRTAKADALEAISLKSGIGKAALEKKINRMIAVKAPIDTPYGPAIIKRVSESRKTYYKLEVGDLLADACLNVKAMEEDEEGEAGMDERF